MIMLRKESVNLQLNTRKILFVICIQKESHILAWKTVFCCRERERENNETSAIYDDGGNPQPIRMFFNK